MTQITKQGNALSTGNSEYQFSVRLYNTIAPTLSQKTNDGEIYMIQLVHLGIADRRRHSAITPFKQIRNILSMVVTISPSDAAATLFQNTSSILSNSCIQALIGTRLQKYGCQTLSALDELAL